MKLISSKGKGQRVLKGNGKRNAEANAKNSAKLKSPKYDASASSKEKKQKQSGRLSTKKKIIITLASVFGLMLLVGTGAFAIVRWQVQPFYDHFFRPGLGVLASNPISVTIDPSSDPESPERPVVETTVIAGQEDENTAPDEITRNLDVFTFLILGIDDYANTDVIMVATFDTSGPRPTLEVVSIPRDTLVNVSWSLKKANSIMAMMQNRYRNENDSEAKAMQATVDHFRNLLGFEVDFWVTLNPRAFIRLVDAVGPIEFHVPADIYEYGISVPRGTQRLNGIQALTVMRARRVYADGDFGRVNTQHNFMNTVASTLLANRNNISVVDYANIFIGNVRTDIQLNHLVWFGREFLTLDANDINFSTMPVTPTMIRGGYYATIHLDEWLEIVNDKLSPLTREITAEDVSILTRGPDRRLFVTDDNWQGSPNWGR